MATRTSDSCCRAVRARGASRKSGVGKERPSADWAQGWPGLRAPAAALSRLPRHACYAVVPQPGARRKTLSEVAYEPPAASPTPPGTPATADAPRHPALSPASGGVRGAAGAAGLGSSLAACARFPLARLGAQTASPSGRAGARKPPRWASAASEGDQRGREGRTPPRCPPTTTNASRPPTEPGQQPSRASPSPKHRPGVHVHALQRKARPSSSRSSPAFSCLRQRPLRSSVPPEPASQQRSPSLAPLGVQHVARQPAPVHPPSHPVRPAPALGS